MFQLAFKDLKLFFTDRRAMLLTFLLPVTLITLFAFAFGGIGKAKNEVKEYDLPVCDLDLTEDSKTAIAALDTDKAVHVVMVTLEQAQEDVKKGNKDCVLIFHKGFADSLLYGSPLPVELQYDEAQEIQVSMLQRALFTTLAMVPYSNRNNAQRMLNKQFDKLIGGGNEQLKAQVHAQSDSLFKSVGKGVEANPKTSSSTKIAIGSDIKMTKLVEAKEENSPGLIQAVAGTAIMMLLFSVAAIGAGLLDEKQEGTLKKLLYSPMHPNNILFGKMITANSISILQLTVMFIYATVAFGLDIFSHVPSLVLMIVVTAYACSSFGVLLASFAKTRQQVQGFSTLIVLVMSCIGGSMIPIFIMPEFMQKIAVVSVNYWSIQGFYDIFWRTLPLTDTTFLTRILVLFVIGSSLNLVALRMFKKNILQIA
ncbi:MAG: ABC transporter permease [Bacteroidetes bacterium]|nr:ABC transporter permease [Bacteroidota bacterium]